MSKDIHHNWIVEEIKNIYHSPLLELVFKAASLHRKYNDTIEIKVYSACK